MHCDAKHMRRLHQFFEVQLGFALTVLRRDAIAAGEASQQAFQQDVCYAC